MTDPFEDFEFKPLTEGLGFHKKAEKIKHDIKSTNIALDSILEQPKKTPDASPSSILNSSLDFDEPHGAKPATESISDLIASLPPSLDFIEDKAEPTLSSKSSGAPIAPLAASSTIPSTKLQLDSSDSSSGRPQIFQPLARPDYKSSSMGPTVGSILPTAGAKASIPSPIAPPMPSAAPVSAAASPSPYREKLEESFARAFPHVEKNKREQPSDPSPEASSLEPVSTHLGAAFLDGMVVAGISTILLVCILAITRINLIGMLTNTQTEAATQLNLALLFLVVTHIYMLAARSFFGASLGEWAFDMQLGRNEQHRRGVYPLLAAWRMILVTITGFIVLPILSLIFRRDLAGYLSGVKLYRRP